VVRYADSSLQPNETFLEFYSMTTGSDAQTMTAMICDVLLRLNVPLSLLRGQTYDGASNMSRKTTTSAVRSLFDAFR